MGTCLPLQSRRHLLIRVAILIVYMLWSFLCSRFDKHARVADRNVKIWELLHFPLSFGLLLLLGAIVVCTPVCL